MNKYKKAFYRFVNRFYGLFDFLDEDVNDEDFNNIEILDELVERATPKKPIKRYYTEKYGNNGTKKRVDIICSCCNSSFTNGVRISIGVFEDREKDFIETVKEINYCGFLCKKQPMNIRFIIFYLVVKVFMKQNSKKTVSTESRCKSESIRCLLWF